MTLAQCNGNYNYMYEWRLGDEWYPCHLCNVKEPEGYICIFTRNGTIMSEKTDNVRKMSKEHYIAQRTKDKNDLGEYFTQKGYHDTLEEDLSFFEVS